MGMDEAIRMIYKEEGREEGCEEAREEALEEIQQKAIPILNRRGVPMPIICDALDVTRERALFIIQG